MSIPERAFLGAARRALLATMAPDRRARLVPICFVLDSVQPVLYTPIDEKPKTVDDPRSLARVRDLLADPHVSVLVDRWDEDWAQLAWLRCLGSASLLEPGADGAAGAEHDLAIVALRAKYPQYVAHRLETRPIIRVAIERTTSWGRLELD